MTFLLATALGTPSHAFTAMLRYVGHTLRASHGQNFHLSLWDVHEVASDRRNSFFHPIWCLLVSQYFLELLSVCHVILVYCIYIHIYTYMFILFILFFLSELFFTRFERKTFHVVDWFLLGHVCWLSFSFVRPGAACCLERAAPRR